MQEFNQLMSSVDRGEYKPFYLLSGTEPYFIDRLEAKITEKITDEADHRNRQAVSSSGFASFGCG